MPDIIRENYIFDPLPQNDAVENLDFEAKMNKALACWQSAWDNMPEEWIEINDETKCFLITHKEQPKLLKSLY